MIITISYWTLLFLNDNLGFFVFFFFGGEGGLIIFRQRIGGHTLRKGKQDAPPLSLLKNENENEK